MSENRYLESVANAFKEAKAWRAATLFLGGVSLLLAYQLVSLARNQAVVLVPYSVATDNARLQVTTNGEIQGTSNEYMANLALADLGLILNFTPENVLTTHKRFLNRLTDSTYKEQESPLLAKAADYKTREVTQSFFPTNVRVSKDRTRVEVDGLLLASLKGTPTLRTTLTYIITYEVFKGYAHVSSVTQKTAP